MNSAATAEIGMSDQRPFVFISYSQDSPGHMKRVADLARRILALGIDCRLDQFQKAPPEGWPRWMKRQIEGARLVLVVCTANYRRRFDGEEGRGANWEGYLITQQLYEAGAVNTRAIPVVMETSDAAHIPLELRASQYYQLDSPGAGTELISRIAETIAASCSTGPPATPEPAAADFWTVPFARNPFFTGRERILADLRSGFESRPAQAVTGLGGIGKTEVAVEYAYRNRESYSAVLWAAAENPGTLLSSFAALAERLGLPEAAGDDQQIAAAAVVRWMERNTRWLMVLDFAAEPGALSAFAPGRPAGHILITARNSSPEGPLADARGSVSNPNRDREGADVAGLELGPFEPAEALGFLERRAARAPLAGAEAEAAQQLARELECLPLALEQTAAYARRMRASFADVLAGYRARGARLLSAARPERYTRALENAWAPGFEEVERAAPASADLARFLALLAPAAVPLELIARGGPELGPAIACALEGVAADPLLLDELLAPLLDFSLVARDPAARTCQLHRLVQETLVRSLGEERRIWTERAVRALGRAFPAPEFPVWPVCERLVPHALACAGAAAAVGLETPEAADLLNRTAHYLLLRGRMRGTETLFRRAKDIWEKSYGASHPLTAVASSNLGSYLRMTGNYEEAEALLTAARDAFSAAPGLEPAMAENNLAMFYMETGRAGLAEPLFHKALSRLRAAGGEGGQETAMVLNNLGEICRAQGRYAEARPFYEQALGAWLKTQGVLSPDLAIAINNLGLLESAQGFYAEAERAYARALEITEQAVGPEHPQCATILNNLGDLYRVTERYREAENCLRRAWQVATGVLGPRHPDAARALGNLGLLFTVQERYSEAEPLIVEGLQIAGAALGAGHPVLAPMLNNLGELYRNQGHPDRARPLFENAIAIVEKSSGHHHPELLSLLNNLALTSIAAGDFSGAERHFGRALAIAAAALGPAHPQVKPMVANLAAARILGNRPHPSPEEFFSEALGPGSPKIAAWAAQHVGLLGSVLENAAEIRAEYAQQTAARDAAGTETK